MKFTPRFKDLRLNLRAYKAKLHERMTDTLAEAAQEWIRTAVFIIPVWSGASVATFLPLLSEIQNASLALTISPKSRAPNRVAYGRGESQGAFVADSSGTYTFSYQTDLPHLIYNEFNNANADPIAAGLFAELITPGPYHFQERAAESFQKIASKTRLPNPFEFIN